MNNDKYIPWGLIEQILLVLPVKSLARFKCVCRSWNCHISSPPFIEWYSKIKSKRRVYPIFRKYSFDRRESLYFCWRGRDNRVDLKPPPVGKHGCFLRPVGSSDGIVCFAGQNNFITPLMLWAPSLEESLEVAASTPGSYDLHCYAIGHHPDTRDLNLVQLTHSDGLIVECKLYSHQAREWRTVSKYVDLGLPWVVEFGWQSQSHSGRFHWLVLGEELCTVVWFDMRSEALGLMDLPGRARRVEFPKFGSYDGKLTMLAYGERPRSRGSRHSCAVWVLEDYESPNSWRELGFEIALEEEFKVAGFLENFTLLLCLKSGSKVRYDLRTERVTDSVEADCFTGAYEETFFHLTRN